MPGHPARQSASTTRENCWTRFGREIGVGAVGVLLFCSVANAQSTFGTAPRHGEGSLRQRHSKAPRFSSSTRARMPVRETETHSNGGYQFNSIDVGTYQLQVEAPGFRKD